MKKFGRQAQYYINTFNSQNFSNNQDFEDYDPVDDDLKNQFQNSNIKQNPFNNNSVFTNNDNENNNKNNRTKKRVYRLSEMNNNNPYNTLEINQNANSEEIRNSYKKLILQNHPDKGGNPELFNKIHLAYQILNNPYTKKIIDNFGTKSYDLATDIIENNLLTFSNQDLIDDIDLCIKDNDFDQLFLIFSLMKT